MMALKLAAEGSTAGHTAERGYLIRRRDELIE